MISILVWSTNIDKQSLVISVLVSLYLSKNLNKHKQGYIDMVYVVCSVHALTFYVDQNVVYYRCSLHLICITIVDCNS